MANPETLLGEIEAKTRELIGTAPWPHIVVFCVVGLLVCLFSLKALLLPKLALYMLFHGSYLILLITAKRTTPLLEYIKNKKIEKQVLTN